MADQGDCQAIIASTACTTNTVYVLVAAARHVEVNHQVQAFNVQTTGRNVSSNQNFHAALLQTVDCQLAVLLVFLTVQDKRLVLLRHQTTVNTVCHSAGVGENNGFLISLVGQQPVNNLFFVLVVVSRDDLLTRGGVQLADLIELQVLGIVENLADHLAQTRTTCSGREQHGLLAIRALVDQTLYVFGETHVEHAVCFV